MISLETAKKLKDAGLYWMPRIGDCYYKDDSLVVVGNRDD
jgi:hypothetical protein